MKTIRGNIIDLAEDGVINVLVQGCNCMVMQGKGLALEIKERYPEAYQADVKYGRKGDITKLGEFSWVLVENVKVPGKRFVIVNAYTQYDWKPQLSGKPNADVPAISRVFKSIAETFPNARIGFPKIGAGLARGDWGEILPAIEDALEDSDYTYIEYQA